MRVRPLFRLLLCSLPILAACGDDGPGVTGTSEDANTSTSASDTTPPSSTVANDTGEDISTDTTDTTADTSATSTDPSTDTTDTTDTTSDPVVLSVERNVDGFGQVAINGEPCEQECTLIADVGTSVTVSATPVNGYINFGAWELLAGMAPCEDGDSCTFDLTETTQLRANFAPIHNVAFRTGESYLPSDIGGLSGADELCAAEAQANGIPGEAWVAWLSTSTVAARDRLTGARGWIRLDARPVLDQVTSGAEPELINPISLSATPGPFWADVYTGTRPDGTLGSGTVTVQPENCEDWTADSGTATVGLATAVGSVWTDSYVTECEFPRPLYCLSTGLDSALTPPAQDGRIAFLSTTRFTPDGGVDGADALCAADASTAGLTGNFKALLSTSTATGASRFDLDGEPWVLVDGTPIVAQASDLALEDGLLRGINITADGSVRTGPSAIDNVLVPDPLRAYTGGGFGGPAADNCEDWSSVQPGANGAMGDLQSGYAPGQSCCSRPCTQPRYLYCLEE